MTSGRIGPGSRSRMLSSPRVRIHFCATCSPASSTRSRSGPSLAGTATWLAERKLGRAMGRLSNSWAGEGTAGGVSGPGGPGPRGGWGGRRMLLGGDRLPGEVGLKEGTIQHLHRVRLPDQPLGLVGSERRLDTPQMNAAPDRLGGLHGGSHVLVPGDKHGVVDRAMPGQRLHIRADLRVHALLLAARVEVA